MSKKDEIIALLIKCWEERPSLSIGDIIAQMAYNEVGHTEIALVTDEEMLKGLIQGWEEYDQ